MGKPIIFVVAIFVLSFQANSVSANTVVKVGKHTGAEVLAACNKVGGEFTSEIGFYGCTNNNCDGKGGVCTISCDRRSGQCYGGTPGRFVGGGISGILKGRAGNSAAGIVQKR